MPKGYGDINGYTFDFGNFKIWGLKFRNGTGSAVLFRL